MGAELGSMEQKIFDVEDHVSEAVAAFADCDVVIATVGECSYDIGEVTSIAYLRLSPN